MKAENKLLLNHFPKNIFTFIFISLILISGRFRQIHDDFYTNTGYIELIKLAPQTYNNINSYAQNHFIKANNDLGIGWVYYWTGEKNQAIEHWKKTIVPPHKTTLLLFLIGRAYIESDQLTRASDFWTKTNFPSYIPLLQAEIWINDNDLKQAEIWLETISQNSSWLWYLRGNVQEKQDDSQKSMDAYKRAIELNYGWKNALQVSQAQYSIARLLRIQGELEEARKTLQQSLILLNSPDLLFDLDTNFSHSHFKHTQTHLINMHWNLLGLIQFQQSDFVATIQSYKEIDGAFINKYPVQINIRNSLAHYFLNNSTHELVNVITEYGNDMKTCQVIADELLQSDHEESLVMLYEQGTISKCVSEVDILFIVAQAYVNLANEQAAKRVYMQIIFLDPTNANAKKQLDAITNSR